MKHQRKNRPSVHVPFGPRDYELLLACIRELHSFQDLAALRLWLLEDAFPRLVPSDWYSYNEVDLASPQKTLALLRPEVKTFSALLPKIRSLPHQHPVITRQLNRRICPSAKSLISFPANHIINRTLHEFLPIFGSRIPDFRRAGNPARPNHRLCPPAALRDYSERDPAVLEHFRGQLLIALRNSSRRQGATNSPTPRWPWTSICWPPSPSAGRPDVRPHRRRAGLVGRVPKPVAVESLNWSRRRHSPSGNEKLKKIRPCCSIVPTENCPSAWFHPEIIPVGWCSASGSIRRANG